MNLLLVYTAGRLARGSAVGGTWKWFEDVTVRSRRRRDVIGHGDVTRTCRQIGTGSTHGSTAALTTATTASTVRSSRTSGDDTGGWTRAHGPGRL